jgi:hypothetical protein
MVIARGGLPHDAPPVTRPTRGSRTSAPGCTSIRDLREDHRQGRRKLDSQNKIYVRDRIGLLFDEGSFVEDGRYANATRRGCRRTAW